MLYATEKKPVDAAGSARDEDGEKSESPAKKDGAGQDDAMKEDAAKKDAAAAEKDVEGTVEKVGEDVEEALGDSEANAARKPQVAKAKDASAPSKAEAAGRKGSIASHLPQTGDANLTPPLVFAGIIGVALLGAGIALLFDKRK